MTARLVSASRIRGCICTCSARLARGGKTTAMLNLALQDIAAGRGVGVLDPKGDLARWPPRSASQPHVATMSLASRQIETTPASASTRSELGPGADLDLVAEKHTDHLQTDLSALLGHANRAAFSRSRLHSAGAGQCDRWRMSAAAHRRRFSRRGDRTSRRSIRRRLLVVVQRTQRRTPHRSGRAVLNKLRDFLVRPRLRRLLCQPRSTCTHGGRRRRRQDLPCGSLGRPLGRVGLELVGSVPGRPAVAISARAEALASRENERRDFFLLYVDGFQNFKGFSMPFADALAQARSFAAVADARESGSRPAQSGAS